MVYTFPALEALAHMRPEHLRAIGFSRQKVRALLDLAGAVTRQGLNLESLAQEDIDSIGQQLLRLRGVGRWTAEYALLRGFGRLQVSRGRRRRPENIGALARIFQAVGLRRCGPGGCPVQPYAGLVYFHLLLRAYCLRAHSNQPLSLRSSEHD